jgi:hypothetical protein
MFKHALIAAGAIVMIAGPSLAQTKGAAALDANGDGKVTLSEFQAGRGAQMMARLDADKDGKLSKAEFEAMRKPKADDAAAPAKADEGKGAGRMWSRIDADNDGFVSKAELDSFLASRFKRMDADNDGSLTTAELKPGAGRAKVGI